MTTQYSALLVLNWIITGFVLCVQIHLCAWDGNSLLEDLGPWVLGGVALRSTRVPIVLVWASLPAQGGKSERRQIPGTKQTKKSRNVGWAPFPPELLVTCHLLISWLSLATRYREISVCLWFSHLCELPCRAQHSPSSPRLCPNTIFPFVRGLLSVPHCTQLGKAEEAGEVVLNPCVIQVAKGSCNAIFFFCHWVLSMAKCHCWSALISLYLPANTLQWVTVLV